MRSLLLTMFVMTGILVSSETLFAQDLGDDVVITLSDGSTVTGRLVDKLPTGYLVSVRGKSRTIKYERVASIHPKGQPPVRETAPPPERRRTESQRETPPAESSSIPPAPEIRGKGLLITGLILGATGSVMSLVFADASDQAASDGDAEGRDTYALTSLASLLTGVAGIALAIPGLVMWTKSNNRLRAWEAQYGRQASAPTRGLELGPGALNLAPNAHGAGLAFGIAF